MLTQILEKKVIDAIAEVLPTGVKYQLLGTWQPTVAGVVRNAEEKDSVALVVVSMGTRSRTTFSEPVAQYNGSVVLTVKLERDAEGNALLAFAQPIEKLFSDWQGKTYQQTFEDLDTDDFSVDQIAVSGGQPPTFNFGDKTIAVNWSFAIYGCDKDTNQIQDKE